MRSLPVLMLSTGLFLAGSLFASEQPNIVFILTDNQGAWQLGCYGNPDFRTPHIDRMAKEGVRFTNAFANNAVCSPTRATYLTGLTPSQHGVHRYLRKGGLQVGSQAAYTLEEFTTLPEILNGEGYVCGLSGKWHLGDNANPQDGFSFWVTKQHGHSPGFLNQEVLEDGKFKTIEKHLTEYWTDRGIEFIGKARDESPEKPFFLFLAYNGPYTLTGAVQEPVPSPWSDPYRDHPLPSFPRPEKIHPWQRNQHNLIGNLEVGRNLAGQVTAVDAGVGRILDELKKRNLDENTLVIYAADQGAVAGHAGFWGMGDHSTPLHGRDGTMHIPMIFRWPEKIPAGQVADEIVTNYDFMPSVLSLLGLAMPNESLPSPGRDFSPALRGKPLEDWEDEVFYEFENVRSIRTKTWKYVERLGQEPEAELYDLKKDPDELKNLAEGENQAELKADLQERLHAWFEQHTDPKWDLWKGGGSKSHIGTAKQIAEGLKRKKTEGAPNPAAKRRDRIVPETDHALILPAADAELSGGSLKVNPRHGALAWWRSTRDTATWTVRGAKSGSYTVVLDYAVPGNLAGQEFTITAGDANLKANAESTGGWGKWAVKAIGEIALSKPDLEITFRPSAQVKGEDLLDLRAIQLIPAGSPRLKNLKPAAAPVDPDIPKKPKTVAGNTPAPVSAGNDGVFTLTGKEAALFGKGIALVPGTDPNHPGAAIAGWNRKGERAEWQLLGMKAGRYDLLVDWAMPRVPGGLQKAAVTLDGNPLFTGAIRTTEGEDQFARYVIGTVELPDGDHTISFGPNGPASTWVRLRSLRLVPAAAGDIDDKFTMPPLSVPEGFVIEPVAIPPLVSHPMMACLDDRGRLFVAESSGTNAKAPELLETRPHKILMLEDENGDGVFDRSTVFADNLVLPNGAQWHDGALYACSPPYIWKFVDTDDDGVADEKTPVGGKFGFNGMSSAFHGPVLGPDGRLYWCGGQHGWTLGDTSPGLDLEGPWVSRGPGVFSMWPDGSDPENRAQGGLANPVEVTFSSEGEVFGTVAVYEHLNGRTDALLHWIHGTVYNLKRRGPPVHPLTSRNNLPPMSRRGWVAPPGLCRYRSGGFANGFGEEYRDDIFLTEFNTHRVYRILPERKGASYTTTDEIFLESTSPYTHFTDVFEDADGSLLVVDTGGWFLYGCPTSAIERPEIKGGIYRIRRKSSKPAIDDPRGMELDWNTPSTDWLDDPRFAVRDRAKTELAKRGAAIIPALAKILEASPSEKHRREAIWTLTGIDHGDAREIVAFALDDPSPSVRLTAARSLSVWRGGRESASKMAAVTLLQERIRSGDQAQIVREAATALGRIGTAGETVITLIDAVRKNGGEDPYLDHSLIYALIEIDHENLTRSFLKDDDPHVRRAALIACAEMESSKLTAEMVAPLLSAVDPDLRAEALRIATARPAWGGSLVGFLKSTLEARSVPPEIAEALLAFSQNGEVQQLIAASLMREPTREIALEVIRRATLKETPEVWKSTFLETLGASLTVPLIEAIGSRSDFDYDWKGVAENAALAKPSRLSALDIHTRRGGNISGGSFALLTRLLESKTTAADLRIRAATIIGRVSLTEAQQEQCVQLVGEAGPLEVDSLLSAFESGSEPVVLDQLAQALADSPTLYSVPAARLESVFGEHAAGKPLLEKLRAAEAARDSRLNELAATIAKHDGDPERGKAAYTKATCVVCHKVRGEGGLIGPELTTIGAIRSERDLLEAIAFPSATFAREYEPIIVTMKDGTLRMGRLGNETDRSVDLIDAAGQSVTIPLAQITRREMASVSMMPPGLERLLEAGELADLVAFLKSLK